MIDDKKAQLAALEAELAQKQESATSCSTNIQTLSTQAQTEQNLLNTLQGELNNIQAQIDALQAEKSNKQSVFNTSNTNLQNINTDLQAQQAAFSALQADIANLQAQIVALREEILLLEAQASQTVAQSRGFHHNFNSGLDPNVWQVYNKVWGGDFNGCVPENVRYEFDEKAGQNVVVLQMQGNKCTENTQYAAQGVYRDRDANNQFVFRKNGQYQRVGAALCTKEYYGSGKYDVRMRIGRPLDNPSIDPTGFCPAIWTFFYREHYKGDPQYQPRFAAGDGSYSVWNHEIDCPEIGKENVFDPRGLGGGYVNYVATPTAGAFPQTTPSGELSWPTPYYDSMQQEEVKFLYVDQATGQVKQVDVFDNEYHTYTMEWRTELVALQNLTAANVVPGLNDHSGHLFIKNDHIEHGENWQGYPVKLVNGVYHVHRGQSTRFWIDGHPLVRMVNGQPQEIVFTKRVPFVGGRFIIGGWFPSWTGTPDWEKVKMYVSNVSIEQYGDHGDILDFKDMSEAAGFQAPPVFQLTQPEKTSQPAAEVTQTAEEPAQSSEPQVVPAGYAIADNFANGINPEIWSVIHGDKHRDINSKDRFDYNSVLGNHNGGFVSVVQDSVNNVTKNVVCLHADSATKQGACLVTNQHFASGEFNVRMKIDAPPEDSRPSGLAVGAWLYYYEPTHKQQQWGAGVSGLESQINPADPEYQPRFRLGAATKKKSFLASRVNLFEFGRVAYGSRYKTVRYDNYVASHGRETAGTDHYIGSSQAVRYASLPNGTICDGKYHDFKTVWRTHLVPLPLGTLILPSTDGKNQIVAQDVMVKDLANNNINIQGFVAKDMGNGTFGVCMGQQIEYFIDGHHMHTQVVHVPAISGRLYISAWYPNWSGSVTFAQANVYISDVWVRELNDAGDVKNKKQTYTHLSKGFAPPPPLAA